MSYSSASKDHRPYIHLVGGGSCLAAALAITWLWSSNYTEHRVLAERYATQYQADALREIDKRCSALGTVKRADCEAGILQQAREAIHDAYDLNAQQDGAYWGGWSAILGAVNVFATLVGIYFVWRSLQLNRSAVDAAIQSNKLAYESMIAQTRPWIKIDRIAFTDFKKGELIRVIFDLRLKNIGNAPAHKVITRSKIVFGNPHSSGSLSRPNHAEELVSTFAPTIFPEEDCLRTEAATSAEGLLENITEIMVDVIYTFEGSPKVHHTATSYSVRIASGVLLANEIMYKKTAD